MKTIPLTRGKAAIIDDADANLIARFKWHAHESNSKWYAMTDLGTFGRRTMLYMHRLLLKTKRGETIDHINGDGLDNRMVNLRIASRCENQANRGIQKNNVSGFKGVSWHKPTQKWKASITVRGKDYYLGVFSKKKDAAIAFDEAAVRLIGEFAFVNFPKRKLEAT